jgi:hypothetical protein
MGATGYAGAVLRQSAADEKITVELHSTKTRDPELALKQNARIISVSYCNGNEFLGAGERDRVIAELQTRFPGHRPVLFAPLVKPLRGRSSLPGNHRRQPPGHAPRSVIVLATASPSPVKPHAFP